MTKSNLNKIQEPVKDDQDPLTSLLRSGARALLKDAVEAELHVLLEEYKNLKLCDGRQQVVRNGYLPERTIQTGIGDVVIRMPKVRDRGDSSICFNSSLLPPYLKRTKSIEELIPWLYLKGISTGDYKDALVALLGKHAKGLSANTIVRLKQKWLQEHREWVNRDLSDKQYVYFWADGIYSNVRMDDKLCLLVIIGVTQYGTKELVAVEDGYRESTSSWMDVLLGLKERGLVIPPNTLTADGAMGFWKALSQCYPETCHQSCWVHKTANVLNAVPKIMQSKVKSALHEIWMAPTKDDAYLAFERTIRRFEAKYPKAMHKLTKDKESLLAFYDFPAEHWMHIRTSNPIESTFATVRLRTRKGRNCGSRDTTLAMVYQLLQSAQKHWRRLKGFKLLTLVAKGIKFKDGVKIENQSSRNVA